MKQEEIKFVYKIDSVLELEETLISLSKELKLTKGILEYFSLDKDDMIREVLSMEELKNRAIEISSIDGGATVIFDNVEIVCLEDDDCLEVLSKNELKLMGIETEKTFPKK